LSFCLFVPLYIKTAKTGRRIAFCCSLEPLAQCASNESNLFALRQAVQVLLTDETEHVY